MSFEEDYAENYKYGIYVGNHAQLSENYLHYAVPTQCISYTNIDDPIPKPSKEVKRVRLTKYCTHKKRPSPFVTIYKLPKENFNELLKVVQEPHFLNSMTENKEEKYIVKVIKVTTKKDVNTALKEFYMTHTVHSSEVGVYRGANITCKPFYAGMYWSGRTWKFMSVYEEAQGIPLSVITSSFWLKARHDTAQIIETVETLVRTLWILGFAHNDLYPPNIIYDLTSHTAKLIDFEMATQLPSENIAKLQTALQDGEAHLPIVFAKYYKETAVSLLYLSKSVCVVPMDDDGFIYNTDDHFLPILYNNFN